MNNYLGSSKKCDPLAMSFSHHFIHWFVEADDLFSDVVLHPPMWSYVSVTSCLVFFCYCQIICIISFMFLN